jgi:chaperonin GroES
MAIQPLGQRVLLKRVETETISAGGIVLVDSAQEKPQEAIVIALGTGGKNEDGSDFEFAVSVNDKVLISKYGGTDVKVDGEDHLIMSESDILGIIG